MEIKTKEDAKRVIPGCVTIAPRRGFEGDFISHNPILRKDELCIIYDDILKSGIIPESSYGSYVRYKRGDGISCFTELPYIDPYDAINNGLLYCVGAQKPSAKITLDYNLFDI